MINSIILLHRGDLSDQIIRQITSVNPLASSYQIKYQWLNRDTAHYIKKFKID